MLLKNRTVLITGLSSLILVETMFPICALFVLNSVEFEY